ncbi:hypothetical protein ACWGOE_07415 [Leucobacter chromiiresistens]
MIADLETFVGLALGVVGALLAFVLGKLLTQARAERKAAGSRPVILKQVARATFVVATMNDLSWSASVMVEESRAPVVFVRDLPTYFTRCVTDPAKLSDFPKNVERPDARFGLGSASITVVENRGGKPELILKPSEWELLARNRDDHAAVLDHGVEELGGLARDEAAVDALGVVAETDLASRGDLEVDGLPRAGDTEAKSEGPAVDPALGDEVLEGGDCLGRQSSGEVTDSDASVLPHECSPVRGGRGAVTPRDPDMTVQETVDPGPPGIDDGPAAGPDLPAAGPPSSPKH